MLAARFQVFRSDIYVFLSLYGVDFTRKKLSVSVKGVSQFRTWNRLSYNTLITQTPPYRSVGLELL